MQNQKHDQHNALAEEMATSILKETVKDQNIILIRFFNTVIKARLDELDLLEHRTSEIAKSLNELKEQEWTY